MSSNITYNGVLLKNVLIESVEQETQYEQTNVDPLYIRRVVTCRTIVHTSDIANSIGINISSPLGFNLVQSVERLLLEPRKRFTLTIGGSTVYDVRPHVDPSGAVFAGPLNRTDVMHGPRPKLTILKVISEHSVHIRFSVVICTPNCDGSAEQPYLNLRWWVADQLDGNTWLTRRTYHGRLRVISKAIQPHWLRGFTLPPLQPGFRRVSADFTESPDGLNLEFTIADQEIWAAPPSPATQWSGYHMVSTPYAGGALAESECRVEVWGDKKTPQRDLISLATRIVDAKLHFIRRTLCNQSMLMHAAINASLHENRCEVSARIRHTETKGNKYNIFNVVGGDLGINLPGSVSQGGYDPQVSRILPPFGTTTLHGAFLSMLQTSCSPLTMPQALAPKPESASAGQGSGPRVTLRQGTLSRSSERYSDEHKEAGYSYYKSESETDSNEGRVQLPIAASVGSPVGAAFITLFQGLTKRTVKVDAERFCKDPELPKPEDFTDNNGIQHKVLSHKLTPKNPILAADGLGSLHAAEMEIVYGLSRKPSSSDRVRIGTLPYVTQSGQIDTALPYISPNSPRAIG